MVNWKVIYTKQALKDAKKIKSTGLKERAEKILKILERNPYQTTPAFEKLVGDLSGAYSRRINIQHRIVYQIFSEIKIIKVTQVDRQFL